MKIKPLGDSALLINFADETLTIENAISRSLFVAEKLAAAAIPGVVDVTSAYQSVCVFFDLSVSADAAGSEDVNEFIQSRVRDEIPGGRKWRRGGGKALEIPVCYDEEFALDAVRLTEKTSLEFSEIVRRHSRAEYLTACIGFMPGFPYLAGLPAELAVERLPTPRTRVPAGSVAVAGRQAGIYPFESPGGWNIIGRTPLRMFDPKAGSPSLLTAGDHVRFRPITRQQFNAILAEHFSTPESPQFESTASSQSGAAVPRSDNGLIKVISGGFQTTVQDCGRTGFRQFGVGTAGALDPAALRVTNLVVGNDETAAGLEVATGRVRLRFEEERLLAWEGGMFEVRVNDRIVPRRHCAAIAAGQAVEIAPKGTGRGWVGISGGIEVPAILSSRSTDMRSRFGGFEGRPLRAGDELPLGKPAVAIARLTEQLSGGISGWSAPVLANHTPVLRILPGPNWDDFAEEARRDFLQSEFQVGTNSDRMGLRLEGVQLRSLNRELVSEAVVPGTIQIPAAGAPIVLLADCGTIGGYPKIANVITVDLARAAQFEPGQKIRFQLVTLQQAQQLFLTRERTIAMLRVGLRARFS